MRSGSGYLERTIDGLRGAIEQAQAAERTASQGGLLQRLDPRVKLIGLLALAVSVTFVTNLWIIACVLALSVVLGALSNLPPWSLAIRVWLGVLALTGAIALPALFLVPGEAMWHLPFVPWPITIPGARAAAYLVLRVETTATLACLLVFTTPGAHLLKALRVIRVPAVVVVLLGMTYRYILLMLETAHEMFESRRSRIVGALTGKDRRRLAVNAAGALIDRTFYLSGEVYTAMQARGFRGQVHLLHDFRMQAHDWIALALFVGASLLVGWTGR
jgi:cobalt ECF transporter T component CbiQ